MKMPGFRFIAVAALLAASFFSSPIPHTPALRSLLLLGLVATLVPMWRTVQRPIARPPSAFGNIEILTFGALTLWMFVQSMLWAPDRAAAIGDLAREWIGAFVVAGIGFHVVRNTENRSGRASSNHLLAWVVLALFAHAVWLLMFQMTVFVKTGVYLFGAVPYGDYAVLSTPINMAFALLAADLACRRFGKEILFPWSDRLAITLSLITLVAVITVRARNGVISVVVVLILLAALLAWRERRSWNIRRSALAVLVLVGATTALVAMTMRSDPRWADLGETIPIALDTDTYRAWLNEKDNPLPMLSSGNPAEGSAYARIAWGKIAIEGIVAQPLGRGYGLGAFGHYVKARYGGEGFVSSHSGLLDFTLANGVPALILLLAFFALLSRRGWLAWEAGNPWGLALILTLVNYVARIFLDGHFGSFRLKMVALLLGILYYLTIRSSQVNDNP